MLGLLDNAALVQHLGRNLGVGVKVLLERVEAHFDPLFLKNISKATLGQPTMQRHLAAFKAGLRRISRARLLPLFATTGGLAEPRAWSATEPLLLVRRSFCRMKIVKAECHGLI